MAEEDHSDNQTAEPASIEKLIERWWADHFPGSAVARDTGLEYRPCRQGEAEAAVKREYLTCN
jgi:hypothetical protein